MSFLLIPATSCRKCVRHLRRAAVFCVVVNGWFGDADGCIGLMRTATQTRFYARSNSVWKYEVLS